MRLAIADPPYLGRGAVLYGPDADRRSWGRGSIADTHRAGTAHLHPEASIWDDPETHRRMVDGLASFDGWVIALAPDNLASYLRWVPAATRVASWHKPSSPPSGARVRTSWEPVLVFIPPARRGRATGLMIADTLTASRPALGFVGSKPPRWTRWVLDMMGYDPDRDTVDDLFAGSGAVAREIAQGVLL